MHALTADMHLTEKAISGSFASRCRGCGTASRAGEGPACCLLALLLRERAGVHARVQPANQRRLSEGSSWPVRNQCLVLKLHGANGGAAVEVVGDGDDLPSRHPGHL